MTPRIVAALNVAALDSRELRQVEKAQNRTNRTAAKNATSSCQKCNGTFVYRDEDGDLTCGHCGQVVW